MKRFLALFLVLVLAFSCILVSCKKDEPVDDEDDNDGEGFIGITAATSATTLDPNGGNTNTDFTWTDDENGTTVYVRAAALWLRSDTNTSEATRVTSAEFGQSFKRVKYNDAWTLVQVDQDQYYVKTSYITTDPGSVIFKDDEAKTTVYVTQEKLFLRTSTLYKLGTEKYDGNIGATVKKGDALTRVATSQNGMWIRVEYTYTTEDNQTKTIPLYCNTDYTSATAPGSSTPDNSGSANTPVVPEG